MHIANPPLTRALTYNVLNNKNNNKVVSVVVMVCGVPLLLF